MEEAGSAALARSGGWEFLKGFLTASILNFIVAALLLLFLFVGLNFVVGLFYLGAMQLVYLLPISWWARNYGRQNFFRGIMTAGLLTILLNIYFYFSPMDFSIAWIRR